MMEILKYFWQLPQLIAALIYYWHLKRKDEILDTCTCQGAIVFIKRKSCGSVTLGNHIFLSPRATDTTVRHEWGHTRQSLILGPLFLIVIGIPSIIWAATHRAISPNKPYDWFYTEAWANKLGDVD